MSNYPYTVLTDLRQATRFGREFGAEEVVIWSVPGEEKLAYVHDESLGGLGLYLDDLQGIENGTAVDMVYAGQLLRGSVRHIEPRDEGGYIVGFECHQQR
ncbi:MAG: hypothetical protein H6822_10705 [Planctomycetaceae bacterium]|nr:hypothetical protein [Planctomycetales bacterium]MCB9922643.1 hypothetical protein [Planctomycetaceae bacterium]